jgi:hypothetical protein
MSLFSLERFYTRFSNAVIKLVVSNAARFNLRAALSDRRAALDSVGFAIAVLVDEDVSELELKARASLEIFSQLDSWPRSF